MVVQSEEELQARINAGWRLKRDAKGFRVWDPKTGAEERISADLEDIAAKIYARQKYEKVKPSLNVPLLKLGLGHFVVAAYTIGHHDQDIARPPSEAEG